MLSSAEEELLAGKIPTKEMVFRKETFGGN